MPIVGILIGERDLGVTGREGYGEMVVAQSMQCVVDFMEGSFSLTKSIVLLEA